MSKELPYFRFYPSEWLEGDITLENEKTQGLFMQICSWYWKKDCSITLDFINKRLIKNKATLKQCLNSLIDSDVIKIIDNEFISINFLNNQYDILSIERKKKVDAGRKGGKATLKQKPSYKDNNKENNNISIRKDKFSKQCFEFLSLYSKNMILDFVSYWTELNKSKTKMKFELQQTFEIKRRLSTWNKNNFNKDISKATLTINA